MKRNWYIDWYLYNNQKLEEGLSENAAGAITFQVDILFHFRV